MLGIAKGSLEVKLPTYGQIQYNNSGESSQRRERARREKVNKQRSTRKTIQAREKFRKVMKSRDTLCFLFFVFFGIGLVR
jgi:hypothetical protein